MDIETLESELRNKADYCHNNISSKTWEDWENMASFLLEASDVVWKMKAKLEKADAAMHRVGSVSGYLDVVGGMPNSLVDLCQGARKELQGLAEDYWREESKHT